MHLLLYYTWIQLHAYTRTHAHTLVFAYNHKFYICFIRYHCHPRLATYVISPPGEVPAQPSFSRRLQEAPKRGVWMAFPGRRVYKYIYILYVDPLGWIFFWVRSLCLETLGGFTDAFLEFDFI